MNSNFRISTELNRLFIDNRKIPFLIMLKIWLGNVINIIGLAFVLFGLPFAFIFISASSIFNTTFSEDDPVCTAIITSAEPTNTFINKVQVYEYHYQYDMKGKSKLTGKGFSTGNAYDIDDEILIYYKKDNPELSKAKDLRTAQFDAQIALFVLIFPLIGIIMLFFGTRKTIKQIYILKIGELTEGKLLFKNPTNTKINNKTVYELTFEFKASNGQIYQTITRSHQVHRLTDEQFEKLIYDPAMPSNAVLLDSLPNGMKNYFLTNI